jgi:hypothetical protein
MTLGDTFLIPLIMAAPPTIDPMETIMSECQLLSTKAEQCRVNIWRVVYGLVPDMANNGRRRQAYAAIAQIQKEPTKGSAAEVMTAPRAVTRPQFVTALVGNRVLSDVSEEHVD